jgi:hypothetical protein
MRKAIARDRSSPSLGEISEFGLMEMTRKRVRIPVPSVQIPILSDLLSFSTSQLDIQLGLSNFLSGVIAVI